MGLLSKASLIKERLAFPEFITKYNIHSLAVLQLKDDCYPVVNSIGFDGSSILSLLYIKGHWDDFCKEYNKEYIFLPDETSLLNNFSFKMQYDIKSISLYRTETNIFILCNQKFSDEIIKDMLNTDYNLDYINLDNFNKEIIQNNNIYKYEINFSEAIESFLSAKNIHKEEYNIFRDTIKTALYNELKNRFSCELGKYVTKEISENTIHVLININSCINEKHLISHIKFYLKSIIEKEAELIEFTNIGTANSLIEIKDFLQVK